jgi:hypothetical protein
MSDDRRANLEVCWRMAEKASGEPERRAWLEMATSWKLLIAIGDPATADARGASAQPSPRLADRIIHVIRRCRHRFVRELKSCTPKLRSRFRFLPDLEQLRCWSRATLGRKTRSHFPEAEPTGAADGNTSTIVTRTLHFLFRT